jgi:hypothetical protein
MNEVEQNADSVQGEQESCGQACIGPDGCAVEPCPMMPDPAQTEHAVTTTEDVMWSREDVQRVLYHIVRCYEQALELGGDSEILRDAIRIGRETLKGNNWWPNEEN